MRSETKQEVSPLEVLLGHEPSPPPDWSQFDEPEPMYSIPDGLPSAGPCGDCGCPLAWLTCYDESPPQVRCWQCSHPPSEAMIGTRLAVICGDDGLPPYSWEASPADRWVVRREVSQFDTHSPKTL